ncbi:MAG: formate/nitrite transporter family protein [Deltaproteobacteria bacterium]|nr:formate/nitrite transporter family protein [Deltaproteobacteria bacterium]
MSELKNDAYSPQEISERVKNVGTIKANRDFLSTFVLALLAGAFISFGAVFFTLVIHDSSLPLGLTKLIGGLVFCLGLILVVIAGAELFTGNNLIIMAYVDKEITLYKLLRNWVIVYIGNLVGALSMVMWIYLTRQWEGNNFLIGTKALLIANAKVNLPFMVALTRGIMCNVLVCLAVWLCFSGRSVTDKILAIIFPITAFVALGFEHSVANMYFIPMGIILKSVPAVVSKVSADLSNLTWLGFAVKNLIPVTIGNIIGGGVLVAAVYWLIYERKK